MTNDQIPMTKGTAAGLILGQWGLGIGGSDGQAGSLPYGWERNCSKAGQSGGDLFGLFQVPRVAPNHSMCFRGQKFQPRRRHWGSSQAAVAARAIASVPWGMSQTFSSAMWGNSSR